MKHTEVTHGMRLAYQPSSCVDRWFVGTVDGKPFALGPTDQPTWCVKLRDMPADYATYTGKKGPKAHTVYAASLDACRKLEDD